MGCSSSVVKDNEKLNNITDDYIVGCKLGEGAFGQVRAATKKTTGKPVAVKILDLRVRDPKTGKALLKPDRMLIADAKEEMELWKKIGANEHLVHLYETYMDRERFLYYMVMEKCASTLMESLGAASKTSESDMAHTFKQMLLGIDHVHRAGIVHRDIKPDNFLVGGPEANIVKLCDFGLSVSIPKNGQPLCHITGSLAYMSPEMLKKHGYCEKTDVWSFGATAYLMTYGEYPYMPKRICIAAMEKAIVEDKPRPKYTRLDNSTSPSRNAIAFIRFMLTRGADARPTAAQALLHTFVWEKVASIAQKSENNVSGDTSMSNFHGPVITLARQRTTEFERKVNPIVQRNLDEVLQKLHAKLPYCSAEHLWFSEGNDASSQHLWFSEGMKEAEKHTAIPDMRRSSTFSGALSGESSLTSKSTTASAPCGEVESQGWDSHEYPAVQGQKSLARVPNEQPIAPIAGLSL